MILLMSVHHICISTPNSITPDYTGASRRVRSSRARVGPHCRDTGEPPRDALRGVDPGPGASRRPGGYGETTSNKDVLTGGAPFCCDDRLFLLTWAHV